MVKFTFIEYADMHLVYGLASGNSSEARRLYAERFPDRIVPACRTFVRVDRNLRETGSVLPKRGGEGQQRTVRTPALEQNVLDAVDADPTTSEQLLYPFHIQKVHAMEVEDYPARLAYARWFLDKHRKVLFTDEAGFTRDDVINSHNLHVWADDNPHSIIQTKNQRRFCVNLWAGIVFNNLVGPYFVDYSLNGQRYLEKKHINYSN